jgi:hypothetical protein|tara:strand:+ start:77242 stop:77478 length:237 start_codon:yes stop_codon:yes gene_type:complete
LYLNDITRPALKIAREYFEVGILISQICAVILRIYQNHLLGRYDDVAVKDSLFMPAKNVIYFSNPDVEEVTFEVAIII